MNERQTERLNKIFNLYVDRYDTFMFKEAFKWEAVAHFQKNWQIDAQNFPAMFFNAFDEKKMDVLIDNSKVIPLSAIRTLIKNGDAATVESVKSCFVELFSDDCNDRYQRQKTVERFVKAINSLISKRYYSDGMYIQSAFSALRYLTLWRPWENYFYFYRKTIYFASLIGYKNNWERGDTLSLPDYYQFCDDMLAVLDQNVGMEKIAKSTIGQFDGVDTMSDEQKALVNRHLLVYDVIYSSIVHMGLC